MRELEIRIGLGSCGIASGAEPVRVALEAAVKKAGANGVVKKVGCNGMCHLEPLVEVVGMNGSRALYGGVTPNSAAQIVERHVKPKNWLTRVHWRTRELRRLFSGGDSEDTGNQVLESRDLSETVFFDEQKRIVLENCGENEPAEILV